MDATRPTDVREQDIFDEFHLGDVRGRTVIDRRGATVGTLEDVAIDPKTWRVSGFVLALRRDLAHELGIPARGFLDSPRINLSSERIATFGENVILNVDTFQIRELLRRPASDVEYDERNRLHPVAARPDPLYRVDDPGVAPETWPATAPPTFDERRWP